VSPAVVGTGVAGTLLGQMLLSLFEQEWLVQAWEKRPVVFVVGDIVGSGVRTGFGAAVVGYDVDTSI
jgi:hypothetical protein